MTAIAAISTGSKVYIGADSAGSNERTIETRSDSKIFKKGKLVIGFTTSYRMGQLLRYSLSIPSHPKSMKDVVEYMSTKFVDSVRSCLKKGGFATSTNGEEGGGTFIVGYNGSIYVIYSDFQVAIPSNNYHAVGCGDHLCLGSLHTTSGYEISPTDRITLALNAAQEHSPGVRGPFEIISG